MGLFQHKQPSKSPHDDAIDEVEQFFDDDFRAELREHGRLYFERVINENAALFKQDLDATVAHINTELKQHMARQLDSQFAEIAKANSQLKEHVAKQLDERFEEYDKTIKDAQELALQSLNHSAQALHDQHQQLARLLQKSVADQETKLTTLFNENTTQIAAVKEVQATTVQTLTRSVQALEEQHQQLSAMLQQSVSSQQEMLVDAFEQNMAQIIEHYLLGALGDQYDLKAQLPSIIKQMEANKQTIADDMKL